LVLKVVELGASDGEEGAVEEVGWWGRDVVVEERRCQRGNVLTWEKCLLDGGSGGVDVVLVY